MFSVLSHTRFICLCFLFSVMLICLCFLFLVIPDLFFACVFCFQSYQIYLPVFSVFSHARFICLCFLFSVMLICPCFLFLVIPDSFFACVFCFQSFSVRPNSRSPSHRIDMVYRRPGTCNAVGSKVSESTTVCASSLIKAIQPKKRLSHHPRYSPSDSYTICSAGGSRSPSSA